MARIPCPSCGTSDYDEFYSPGCHVVLCGEQLASLKKAINYAVSVIEEGFFKGNICLESIKTIRAIERGDIKV